MAGARRTPQRGRAGRVVDVRFVEVEFEAPVAGSAGPGPVGRSSPSRTRIRSSSSLSSGACHSGWSSVPAGTCCHSHGEGSRLSSWKGRPPRRRLRQIEQPRRHGLGPPSGRGRPPPPPRPAGAALTGSAAVGGRVAHVPGRGGGGLVRLWHLRGGVGRRRGWSYGGFEGGSAAFAGSYRRGRRLPPTQRRGIRAT